MTQELLHLREDGRHYYTERFQGDIQYSQFSTHTPDGFGVAVVIASSSR